jgi:AcrR family transcriptional regulator
MTTASRKRPYHHGDLPAALVAASLELIGESGVRDFSVAAAARRTGVSISAPYRHFADRDELIAACAIAACEELRRRFEVALSRSALPAERLAAASAEYVRFAAERRPMFDALFGAGLDKTRYPRLEEAAATALETVLAAARELAPGGEEAAAAILVEAITALAQGHAARLLEGGFGEPPAAVGVASERVAAATLALIRGRSLLFE